MFALVLLPKVNDAVSADPAPRRTAPESPAATPEDFARAHGLSPRETEVLFLIAAGRDVPYIENKLSLAKSTVKTHVKHIYEKCGVSSRQDLLDLIEAFAAGAEDAPHGSSR